MRAPSSRGKWDHFVSPEGITSDLAQKHAAARAIDLEAEKVPSFLLVIGTHLQIFIWVLGLLSHTQTK